MITRTRSKIVLNSQEGNLPVVEPKMKQSTNNMTRSQSKRKLTMDKDEDQPAKQRKSNLATNSQSTSRLEALKVDSLRASSSKSITRQVSPQLAQPLTRASSQPATKRCFVNLTNFKSPKSRIMANLGNKVTNYFSPVRKEQSTSQQVQVAESAPLTQSGEIVLSQIPAKNIPGTSKEELISAMRGFKKALEKDFKNVSCRLQLQAVPPFLYDLKDYQKNFSRTAKFDFSKSESEYMARSFLSDNRHFLFINYVRNTILGQREFPGIVVIRGILELIMKIKDEEVKTLNVSTHQSINELYSLFNSILMTFPHSSLQSSYLELFESPFNYTKSSNKPCEKSPRHTQPGVLHSMLSLLTDLMQRDDANDALNQSNSHENINNFFLWDKRNEEKSSFQHFPRDEKFERIFVVLDLITTVLENDMAIFIVKHSRLRTTRINNNEQRPLICSILWQHDDGSIAINELIRNIVFIFVSSVALNYPRNNVQVMARLMNLLSHVMNLHEYSNETEYPCYKSHSTSLAQEILKVMESSAYYNVDLVTSVAESLRSPLTKMLLVNQLVQKIHSTARPISLSVPFDLIRKKEFLKFKNISMTKTVNNKKYPVIDVAKTASQFEVNQRSYLKLLRIYAESVNSYYCVQAGLVEMNSSDQGAVEEKLRNVPSSNNSFDYNDFDVKIKAASLDEEVKLRKVDLTFKKQINIKLSKESCEFYLSEIKNFYLLSKLIKKCHEKFGAKFDDWMNMVSQMELKDSRKD